MRLFFCHCGPTNSKCVRTNRASLHSWNALYNVCVCDVQNICSCDRISRRHSFISIKGILENGRKQKKTISSFHRVGISSTVLCLFEFSREARSPWPPTSQNIQQIHARINNIFWKCCQKNSSSNRIYDKLIHSLRLFHFVSFRFSFSSFSSHPILFLPNRANFRQTALAMFSYPFDILLPQKFASFLYSVSRS